MIENQTNAYVPGVCNINRAEIAMRKKAGYIGVVVYVILLAVFIIFSLPSLIRLSLFAAAFLGAIGFLQAREHFCVAYAASGEQNANEGSTKASAITDADAHVKDKKRASQIYKKAFIIALFAALSSLAIPPYHF